MAECDGWNEKINGVEVARVKRMLQRSSLGVTIFPGVCSQALATFEVDNNIILFRIDSDLENIQISVPPMAK